MSKWTISWNPSKWVTLFFTIWTGQTLSWIGSAVAQFGLVDHRKNGVSHDISGGHLAFYAAGHPIRSADWGAG